MPLASHTEKVVQPQTQNKEEKEMNESTNNNVAAPLQPVAPIINTETPVNPLDDLAAAIDDFKSRLRAMFDESTILSRKVKEVALAQKQKEREFFQAKRAIEKIRMAI
jgi:type VI protein secretion system component VasF